MSVSLTPLQACLLGFIKAEIAAKGVAPSVREMGAHMHLSSASQIVRLLDNLEQRGHIRRIKFRSRAIELLESSDPIDVAREALSRVGAPATSQNLTRVAGVLEQCKAEAA